MKEHSLVITGPDGSGKSTACRHAARKLEARYGAGSVAAVSIWDALEIQSVFSSKDAVRKYLSVISGEARALFLFHALLQSLHLGIEKHPKFLLIDGYFYKYAASELAYGVPEKIIQGAVLAFPKPSHTIFLDLNPAEAWGRKSSTSAYERGDGPSHESAFLEFQSKMKSSWKIVEDLWGPWEHVSPLSPETTSDFIVTAAIRLNGE